MLNVNNVSLALVLIAPFGLAIHDEITKETLSEDELRALAEADLYGGYYDPSSDSYSDDDFENVYGDSGYEISDEELERILEESRRYAEEEAAWTEEEEVETVGEDGLRELFGQERATLGPSLSDARFGMTHSQVVAAIPTIESGALGDPEMFPGMTIYPAYQAVDDTQLTSITMLFVDPDGAIAAYLATRWGNPDMTDEENGLIAWISADGHTRAAASTENEGILEVEFSQVQSVGEIFKRPGKGKGLFSFESDPPLLQATVKDLERVYERAFVDPYFAEYATLDLPGIATDPLAKSHLEVVLMLREDKVTRVEFELPCQVEGCTDVLNIATKRYGEATSSSAEAGYGQTLRFGKALTMTVYDGTSVIEVVATFESE